MEAKLHTLKKTIYQITGRDFQSINNIDIKMLEDFEKDIKSQLPEDFKAFLLNAPKKFPFFEYEILDIDGIRDNWRILNELQEQGEFDGVSPWYLTDNNKIQACWWSRAWIPFAIDGEDNLICIDLAPLSQGSFGQVFYWQTIGGAYSPKFPNFTNFLAWYEKELESGHFFFDKENSILEEIFDEKQLF